MVGTRHYYSCHLWSMNMKRSNYLGVTLWMDRVCKYIPYSWWWTTLHWKGQRGSEWYWRWTPPVVSLVTINSSPRAAFIRPYWWWERRHRGLLQQPHKWWRQMDIDLIKSRPDYMKIEGGNWGWMHTMAANPTYCSNPGFKDFTDYKWTRSYTWKLFSSLQITKRRLIFENIVMLTRRATV